MVDWSAAERESWSKVFAAEISRREFHLSDGALFVLERKLQEMSGLVERTTDMDAAMRALANDSMTSAVQRHSTNISREDIEYAFRKCTYYPFC